MTATEDLRAEHQGILKMLAVMQRIIAHLRTGNAVPLERLGSILEFLKVFADKCHHGKEEDILFPALEAAGMSRDGGPIAVMLHEHTLGRGHIRDMSAALSAGPGVSTAFAEPAQSYVDLLTQHIAKENNVLFVMAERLLGAEALTRMHEDFERLEAERIGPGRHEAFHRLLDELEQEYLV